ncbi:UNVERIFIED_CONTAM: hypothetical protein GTU68_030749 [Idotea baltica]|nr:hypothetical protein [Idotea baltica]
MLLVHRSCGPTFKRSRENCLRLRWRSRS